MSRPRVLDHERALDLWAERLKLREIAERLDAKCATVTEVIRRARARRDPRAHRRYLTFLEQRQS